MNGAELPDIRELVPHSGRMLLLDRLIGSDGESATAELTIRPDHPFASARGVGAWVGIEFMAQTVAAYAGVEARRRGEEPAVGFLVGTRQYVSNVPYFPVGATLQVNARRDMWDGHGVGSFACSITGEGIVAEAVVTVIQPERLSLSTGRDPA